MNLPMNEPTPPTALAWLALGVRAMDTETRPIGAAKVFQDGLGLLNTQRPIGRATHVLLCPVGGGAPWWVHVADLCQPPGSGR
jgi:hypothetical protein